MKKCDLCNKPDRTHFRVKSVIYKNWIFVAKVVGILFRHIVDMLMVEKESQKYK